MTTTSYDRNDNVPMVPENTIKIPKVTKQAFNPDNAKSINDAAGLPLGIKLTGGVKLRADGLTGKGVKVAVIDSGVDDRHKGFDGMVKHQMWFKSGTPLSEDDHGTHVAGTIHMMAPEAELYDYRVFGAGGWNTTEAIVTSIYEACFDGCKVINMSLGGRFASSEIRTAVQFAFSQGVIVCAAAGNEGDDNPLTNERSFPALWPECISVAAVSKEEHLPVANFSNTNPQVDYAGIGVDVVSFKPKPEQGNQIMSGTSMACPHVCGLIAALLTVKDSGSENAYNEIITDDQSLRKLLNEKFLIDIGVKGPDNSTGLGFLTYLSKEEYDTVWDQI